MFGAFILMCAQHATRYREELVGMESEVQIRQGHENRYPWGLEQRCLQVLLLVVVFDCSEHKQKYKALLIC